MPDSLRSHLEDFDFAGEMQNLAHQAEAKASGAVKMDRNDLLLALGQMLRPLAFELESIKRGNSELTSLLTAVGKSVQHPQGAPAKEVVEGISQQLQRIGSVESANQKLFDALHAELKGYKDNFLFDALQKPFIRDLVSLFDDFTSFHEQTLGRISKLDAAQEPAAMTEGPAKKKGGEPKGKPEPSEDERTFLQTLAGNMENQLHHMIEVFLRMEVELTRTAVGAPVDKKVHRIVSFEPAATSEEDALVARSVKPGFTWRERAIRPEEIVAKRWQAPAAQSSATNAAPTPATPTAPAKPDHAK